jgi:beta-N-acetylhexosaminidase
MVRLSVFLLCAAIFPGAAWAYPKTALPHVRSLVIETGDDDFLKPDCRHYGDDWSPPECASYHRQLAAAARALEQQGAAKIVKPAAGQNRGGANAQAKKATNRPLSEHERNAVAAKPLLPLALSGVTKAIPGKSPHERLKYMVGQLLLTGFSGREPEDAGVAGVARDVSEGRVSGVIVRDSNVENYQQLRQLIAAITNYGSEMPALIAIDQPGGPDSVLSEEKGFTFYGAASSISNGNTPREAQLLYRAMGGELAALGVSLNIGPSEDLCREDGVNLSALCYGTVPSRVAAYARAFNFGHHDRGVLTALRHDTFSASLQMSSRKEPASLALVHLLVRGQTSDALVFRVKAMEPLVLTELSFGGLRRKPRGRDDRGAGSHGVVIFEIDAGPGGGPLRYQDVILRAFQAGADMIMVRAPSSFPSDLPALCVEAVETGLKSGRLQMARIEEAYRHVQMLKQRLRAVQPRTKIAGLSR